MTQLINRQTYCKLNASSVDYRLDKMMAPTPSYSQKDLELAVEDYKDGLSLWECEALFAVPHDIKGSGEDRQIEQDGIETTKKLVRE